MTAASLSVAIIGAGPAGAYVAERLVRKNPAAQIDVIDRLPTPFGLIRYGVAPDHQGTKNIERVLSRAFTKGDVQFWGGLKVGADLSLADIQANYDAVVLAVGARQDRRLGIAGEDLAGVYGSAAFVGWYNRHPDHFDLPVDLSAAGNAIIIGAGNVALDVARVLAKTPAELSGSDVPPDVSRQLQSAPWERIRVVGRRGIEMARFGVVELDEMTRLAAAAAKVEAADLEGAKIADRALAEVWARMATAASTGRPVVRFQFCWRPEAIIGSAGRVTAVRFRRQQQGPDGAYFDAEETVEQAADLVVSCIGYAAETCDQLHPAKGHFLNTDGRISTALYTVGWAADGPTGTIATNRPKSHAVADRILAEVTAGTRSGRAYLTKVAQQNRASVTDFAGWQAIDAAERAAAPADRVRLKQLPNTIASL